MLKVPYAPWLFTQLGKWPLKEGEGSTGHLLGFINMPEQLGNLKESEKQHLHKVHPSSVYNPEGLRFGGGF